MFLVTILFLLLILNFGIASNRYILASSYSEIVENIKNLFRYIDLPIFTAGIIGTIFFIFFLLVILVILFTIAMHFLFLIV